MKITAQATFALALLFIFGCGETFYVRRQLPNDTAGRVSKEQVIVSSTEIRLIKEKKHTIYKYWKFIEGKKGIVVIRYEEYVDFVKLTADKIDLQEYSVADDKIQFYGFNLEIYELTPDRMVFYLISQ